MRASGRSNQRGLIDPNFNVVINLSSDDVHHELVHPSLFSFSSHLLSSHYISRLLPVVTHIRGHIAGPSPPSPLRYDGTCLPFYRESEFSILFPRRLASNWKTKQSHKEESQRKRKKQHETYVLTMYEFCYIHGAMLQQTRELYRTSGAYSAKTPSSPPPSAALLASSG